MMESVVNAYRINFDDNHGGFTSEVTKGKLLDEYELGMYAREDLPLRYLTRPIANGDTFVQVYLHVQKSSIPNPDTKLVLVVANSDILTTGFKKNLNNEYICGDEGLVPTSQSTLDDDGILYYKYFSGEEVIDENFEVPLTGLYQYKLFYCPSTKPTNERPKSGEATFKLNGHIQFINPYGQLPGQYFFFLPFQACMTIAYIVFAVLWFLASIFNRKEFLTLQFYITIVLMSCLAESLIVYFDYFLTNKIGSRNFIVQVCSMCMTVIRKIWTRLIILVVCSGYTTASKNEDDESADESSQKKLTTTMIIIYTVIFAVSCLISELGEFLFFREWITHTQYLVTMVPTSFLDFFFYAWALYLLYSTLKMYKPSNPKSVTAKERASQEWKNAVANNHYFYLYRRLLFAMIIYAWTVLVFLVLQFFYEYGQYYRSAWYLNWLFDSASYQIAFFAFFVLVGFLYRPAKHNSLYLHSEQLPTDELDADMMLKEGTGLEYQSDDSDEKDVEMMMMQNNEPIDQDEESDSKVSARKSQEKLVFSEDHETPTTTLPSAEKIENSTQ